MLGTLKFLTLKFEVGGWTAPAFNGNKFAPVFKVALLGGGKGGACGSSSIKSSNVGNVGGKLPGPGPNRSGPPTLLLLLLSLFFLLFEPDLPFSRSNRFFYFKFFAWLTRQIFYKVTV